MPLVSRGVMRAVEIQRLSRILIVIELSDNEVAPGRFHVGERRFDRQTLTSRSSLHHFVA
jgi:hypothetical protein